MAFYHRLLLFLAGFLLFPLGGNFQGICPNNWIRLQGSCYKVSSGSTNWNAAKSACQAMGSKLAMVASQAEQQALASKISQNVWIGLHRDPNDHSRWMWVDGSRATYTHWSNGEPNDYGGNEDCTHMFPPAGKWNDLPCSHGLQYLCETKVKCPKLSLRSGVLLSPSNCRSSNQAYGSTCSFSCARGYRLIGPSSTQCGKGGVWNQRPSTVRCEAIMCPALTVSKLLHTLPSSCGSSRMKINTKCSFTCPQGYQLRGPSYKQCRVDGQWSDKAKKVSCTDIDECSLPNIGGCSHKCVNTMGSYKCQCPDPELSLSPADNKTCHAPGVVVQCNSNNMTIMVPKSLLRGIDREHLRLLDTKCKATKTSAYFSLTTLLTECNTTRRHTASTIAYSNTVLEIPVAAEDVITRVRELEIQFSCVYSKHGAVSSVGWKPNNRKLVFSDEGKGNFTLSLNMFPDKRFVSPYMKDDFPVAVVLRKRLFFEISVTSSDRQLSIIADQCHATPTQDHKNPLKYVFITKGCPNDATVKYHSTSSVSAQRFSLEAFKFIADHPFVFVHCHVILCNATEPGSKCAKKCVQGGRGRRDASTQMTDDVYSLVQGPLHLEREKREQKISGAVNKNGWSASVMVSLLVVCVACLAGKGLMTFKKSRGRPVKYKLLATGDNQQ